MIVVKMIEESYNEPFKTGPLIDQQGHYAIFDILMNRTMFDYISAHNTGGCRQIAASVHSFLFALGRVLCSG
jgi:hypothetical protein